MRTDTEHQDGGGLVPVVLAWEARVGGRGGWLEAQARLPSEGRFRYKEELPHTEFICSLVFY